MESAIGVHLINQSHRESFSVYYWRDRNDEVYFILEKQAKIIAIEVKSSYSKNKKGEMNREWFYVFLLENINRDK